MLGARHGEAIARNNNDGIRIGQKKGSIVGRTTFNRALSLVTRSRGRAGIAPKATQNHIKEAAIHGLAHDVRQNGTRGAHQRARNNKHGVPQREANTRGCPTGIAIQHTDHHRHVRTANGNNNKHAQNEA